MDMTSGGERNKSSRWNIDGHVFGLRHEELSKCVCFFIDLKEF